jgi:hypothetical protein
MPFNMESLVEQAGKLSQYDTAINLGMKAGKFGYKYMTDPITKMGVEAATAASHVAIYDALDDKKQTVGEFAGDALGLVGATYAAGALGTMAAQGLARTEYGSNMVGNVVDKAISKIRKPSAETGLVAAEGEQFTVGKLVSNSMRKFVKPVNMGRLAFGGAGMAVGLLYTMMNGKDDGVGGTSMNLLGGAGIAMMGHELYGHFSEKAIKEAAKKAKPTVKDMATKQLDKWTSTNTGAIWKDMFGEVMDSSAAKTVIDSMNGILDTDHGKAVKSAFESVMNSDWEGIAKIAQDPDSFMENVNKTRDSVREYMESPEGKGALNSLVKDASVELDINKKDLVKASREDFVSMFTKHLDKIRNGAAGANKFYSDNEELVKKGLSHFFKPHEVENIHNFMTGGLSKIVKGLDDMSTEDILNTKGNHSTGGLDTSEDTVIDSRTTKAKDVSDNIAHNEEHVNKETAGTLEQKVAKEKHDASMRNLASQKKVSGWLEKGKLLGAIGLGAFAVATVMDASDRLDHKTETSKMTNEEKKMKDKKQSDVERKYHQQAYGAVNMGDMVTQMFQDRIGHHKMGNAKFASNQYQIQGQTYTI